MTTPRPRGPKGIYQFRKRVPDHLRELVGMTEVKESLGTTDPDEARILAGRKEREVLARWRALEAGVVPLSVKQCRAIGAELFRHRIAAFEDHVEDPAPWRAEAEMREADARLLSRRSGGPSDDEVAQVSCKPILDAFLAERGIVPMRPHYVQALRIAANCLKEAALHLEQAALGIYRAPVLAGYPDLSVIDAGVKKTDLFSAWNDYVAETGISPATRKRWYPVLVEFATFAGTSDFAQITRAQVTEWKRTLLESKLSVRTVRNVKIAAVKALFAYLAENDRIPEDPAAKVKVRAGRRKRTRDQGYDREEAFFILDHARRYKHGRAAPDRVGLIRWVPWLCAYTGARVNEITQMRATDVVCDARDLAMMRITPEAGTVKAGNFRDVPVHPHLVRQGFIAYVLSRGDQPLFYDPDRSRGGSAGDLSRKAGEHLAKWIRRIGITDPRIRPNHAWRHRFQTMSRLAGMAESFSELILGHAPVGASRAYGNYWGMMVRKQIALLPPYDIDGMELLFEEDAAQQIERLPWRFTHSLIRQADMDAVNRWRAQFRIPELPPITDPKL